MKVWVMKKMKMKEMVLLRGRSGAFGLALGEDDLIDEEEDHHGDAAVEEGGADVVDEIRHQQAATATHTQLMELTMQVMRQKATRYQPICLARLPLAAEDKVALDGGN